MLNERKRERGRGKGGKLTSSGDEKTGAVLFPN